MKNLLHLLCAILLFIAFCWSIREMGKKQQAEVNTTDVANAKNDSVTNATDSLVTEVVNHTDGNLHYRLTTTCCNKQGKAYVVVFLHGSFTSNNTDISNPNQPSYLDWEPGIDSIVNYCKNNKIKAYVIQPICDKNHNWLGLSDEIKTIVDSYVNNGEADSNHLYITGTSGGGTGAWRIVQKYDGYFAAAMPIATGQSCDVATPIVWVTDHSAGNKTNTVNALKAKGRDIAYFHDDKDHKTVCSTSHTAERLKIMFSHSK